MAARQWKAKCLCGGVRLDFECEEPQVGACHCDVCRRWSSGPFMAVHVTTAVTLAGTDLIGLYQSSEWGERGFCKACGSTLFWRNREASEYAVSATAIEDLGDVPFPVELFIDSKPDWYAFAGDRKQMTGAEFLAQFTQDQGTPNG
ncbi:MAG: GFA family protein [Pseudomonadota bacterium]|nr:GFA family protein [Pseudomonadota bacterium]